MNRFLPSRSGRFHAAPAAAALDQHLADSIAGISTPAVPAQATGAATMASTPADATSAVMQMMQDHARMMGEIHQTQLELLRASLTRQRDAVTGAVTSVAQKIDGQTDDFMAMMGQISNGG